MNDKHALTQLDNSFCMCTTNAFCSASRGGDDCHGVEAQSSITSTDTSEIGCGAPVYTHTHTQDQPLAALIYRRKGQRQR